MTAGYSGPSGMRVGHDEREAAAAELREHYAVGRLTLEELNERLDAALAAKTRGDLDALMRDLPSSASGTSAGPSAGSSAGTGRARQAIGAMLTGTAVVVALFALGTLGLFGIGAGRPLGIVLILAGLAFLRRLLFGRRSRARARRGPRRRW